MPEQSRAFRSCRRARGTWLRRPLGSRVVGDAAKSSVRGSRGARPHRWAVAPQGGSRIIPSVSVVRALLNPARRQRDGAATIVEPAGQTRGGRITVRDGERWQVVHDVLQETCKRWRLAEDGIFEDDYGPLDTFECDFRM